MLLSKETVNTGRQIEIDLLKAFTVVFSMIIIHVYDYDTLGFENEFTWWLDFVFGGIFAAPIFMFCMGIGTEYSRSSSPKQMALRGLKLLTIGQVLNFFRYLIPIAIRAWVDREYNYWPAMALNFSSDIMQLAGLAFLVLALFRKLKMNNWQILLAAMAMSVCGTLLEHVETGVYGFDQLLGMFWGTDTESFFPLFNWFIFIAAGKCFGNFYKHVANKNLLFLILAPISAAVFALSWHLQMHTEGSIFHSLEEGYYGFSWMRLQDALSVVLMAPGLICIFYLLSKVLPARTCEILSHPSKHINQYYCVSWWWIMIIYIFVWANDTLTLMSVWLNVLLFTIMSVTYYNNHLQAQVEAFCSRHKTVLTILVWAITMGVAIYAFATCTEFCNEFNDYLM